MKMLDSIANASATKLFLGHHTLTSDALMSSPLINIIVTNGSNTLGSPVLDAYDLGVRVGYNGIEADRQVMWSVEDDQLHKTKRVRPIMC